METNNLILKLKNNSLLIVSLLVGFVILFLALLVTFSTPARVALDQLNPFTFSQPVVDVTDTTKLVDDLNAKMSNISSDSELQQQSLFQIVLDELINPQVIFSNTAAEVEVSIENASPENEFQIVLKGLAQSDFDNIRFVGDAVLNFNLGETSISDLRAEVVIVGEDVYVRLQDREENETDEFTDLINALSNRWVKTDTVNAAQLMAAYGGLTINTPIINQYPIANLEAYADQDWFVGQEILTSIEINNSIPQCSILYMGQSANESAGSLEVCSMPGGNLPFKATWESSSPALYLESSLSILERVRKQVIIAPEQYVDLDAVLMSEMPE